VRRFWRSGDSTSKRVLDVLESFYLSLWKIIVQYMAYGRNNVTKERHCKMLAIVALATAWQLERRRSAENQSPIIEKSLK